MLSYLKTLPKGNVIAPPGIAMATYAISEQQPIASAFFNGDPKILAEFYNSKDCAEKDKIIKKNNAKYIISGFTINCSWEEIYNKNGNYIYKP
jgi:hypothetical protein